MAQSCTSHEYQYRGYISSMATFMMMNSKKGGYHTYDKRECGTKENVTEAVVCYNLQHVHWPLESLVLVRVSKDLVISTSITALARLKVQSWLLPLSERGNQASFTSNLCQAHPLQPCQPLGIPHLLHYSMNIRCMLFHTMVCSSMSYVRLKKMGYLPKEAFTVFVINSAENVDSVVANLSICKGDYHCAMHQQHCKCIQMVLQGSSELLLLLIVKLKHFFGTCTATKCCYQLQKMNNEIHNAMVEAFTKCIQNFNIRCESSML